jgi:hypothetical protein
MGPSRGAWLFDTKAIETKVSNISYFTDGEDIPVEYFAMFIMQY